MYFEDSLSSEYSHLLVLENKHFLKNTPLNNKNNLVLLSHGYKYCTIDKMLDINFLFNKLIKYSLDG